MPATTQRRPRRTTDRADGQAIASLASGNPRPSVLLVHERYQQRAGEDTVFDAERGLLERMGHRVDVLLVDNDAIPDDLGIGQKVRLAAETVWSGRAARVVSRRLAARPADIVHVHNTFPLLSPSIYGAARSSGAAVVQTIHNYRSVCPAATLFRDGQPCEDCVGRLVPWPSVVHGCYRGSSIQTLPVAAMLTRQNVTGSWRQVDALIALTEFAAAKLAEGGLPADRLHVKANFVWPDPGPRSGAGDGYVIVGRLSSEKGIDTVVAAVPMLPPGVVVRLVGDGPEGQRVAAAADRLAALQPMGRLEPPEVQTELRRSRALIFPSLVYEGMPMAILEAFASGVPVIAARRGAAAALVEHGVTGLLFEPGDPAGLAAQVAWAETHPGELEQFGRAARERFVRGYTAEASHVRLLAIYAAALARVGSRASN
jgi:glycosyltransferase involved in cell wall biosynthesis